MKTRNTLFILFLAIFNIACKNQSFNSVHNENTTPNIVPTVEDTVKDTVENIVEYRVEYPKIREGERIINNYHVKYNIHLNDVIASIYKEYDEQRYVLLDSSFLYNHSLFLTAYYKGQIIINNLEIRSSSFEGVENPNQFVFIPTSALDFNSINDTLVISTGMSVLDTDWGYDLNINISPTGDVSYKARSYDDDLAEQWNKDLKEIYKDFPEMRKIFEENF